MNANVQRLTIELAAGEPINGRLLDGAGVAHAFHGWLELSTVLERARLHGEQGTPRASAELRNEERTEDI